MGTWEFWQAPGGVQDYLICGAVQILPVFSWLMTPCFQYKDLRLGGLNEVMGKLDSRFISPYHKVDYGYPGYNQ
jgi:hypothetical protein